jgi:hypothetical protein
MRVFWSLVSLRARIGVRKPSSRQPGENHRSHLLVEVLERRDLLSGGLFGTALGAPEAMFANSGPVLQGDGAILSFSGVSGGSGGYTYSYDFDNTGSFEIAGSSSPQATVPALFIITPGDHVAHGRITDSTGGSTDYTTTITVTTGSIITGPPTATFSNGGPINVGQTASVLFAGATGGSGGYTYSYDFSDNGIFEISGSSSAQATVPVSYLGSAGTHVVHGRITDSSGAFTDYTTTITVNRNFYTIPQPK